MSDISRDFKKEMFKVYNKPPKVLSNKFINEKINISKVQEEYLKKNPELVVIDDFLCKSIKGITKVL